MRPSRIKDRLRIGFRVNWKFSISMTAVASSAATASSYGKCIGISKELFTLAVMRHENIINHICSTNEVIYLCHECKPSTSGVEFVLCIMGFDEERVSLTCKELIKLFQQVSTSDSRYYHSIPKDLGDLSTMRDYEEYRASQHSGTASPALPSSPEKSKTTPDLHEHTSHIYYDSEDDKEVYTPYGIHVRVCCGELVKQKAEAIVCLTNCKLQCIGQSSKAVAAAIGCRHTEDCSSYLREHGQLKHCQAMHTDSGNLWVSVRYIIHVAEPKIENLVEPSKQHSSLEEFYFNCLQYANNVLKARSVSVPFFTTDCCEIVSPVIASAICKALIKFDQQFMNSPEQRTLCNVNIICLLRKKLIVQMMTFDIFLPKYERQRMAWSELFEKFPVLEPKRNQSMAASREIPKLGRIEEDAWWKERIKSNYSALQLQIVLENGMEGELIKLEVFERSLLQRAMEESSGPKQNKHLLDQLLQGDDDMFNKFCRALTLSSQGHIISHHLSKHEVNTRKLSVKIIPRSVSESAINDDLKLLEQWKVQNLRKFHNELIEKINCDYGLIADLRSRRIFTDHQIAELEAKKHESGRNKLLLKWLEKGSEGTHKKFCMALNANRQGHLVTNYLQLQPEVNS